MSQAMYRVATDVEPVKPRQGKTSMEQLSLNVQNVGIYGMMMALVSKIGNIRKKVESEKP